MFLKTQLHLLLFIQMFYIIMKNLKIVKIFSILFNFTKNYSKIFGNFLIFVQILYKLLNMF